MMSYDNFMTCLTTCLTTMFMNWAPGLWPIFALIGLPEMAGSAITRG